MNKAETKELLSALEFAIEIAKDRDWTEEQLNPWSELKAKLEQKQIVWVLFIEHRHGTDTSVHTTREAAGDALYEYVSEWWNEEMWPELVPEDKDQAIMEYFDRMQDTEGAVISKCEVED